MIAAISASRSDGNSSFGSLAKYLTVSRSIETGEPILRGPVLLSPNLISLKTAANEMRLVAAAKGGVKEPAVHFQIAWPHGEKPTKEQWTAAAQKCIAVLGLSEHQFVIAAHNDKEHFHVHVMANRIHPETGAVNSLSYSKLKLDKAMRELEHAQGWSPTPGPYKWDLELGQAVRDVARNPDREPGGKKIEAYQDVESVKNFAARAPAMDVRWALDTPNPTWRLVHKVLADHNLLLERGEKGGYTVRPIDSDIRVKASDVFRKSFAGKQNREEIERKLGPFQERVPGEPPEWARTDEKTTSKLPPGYSTLLKERYAGRGPGQFEQPDYAVTLDMTPTQCLAAIDERAGRLTGRSLASEQLAPDQRPLHPPGKSGRGDAREPGSRDERKEQRRAERQALVADFKVAKAAAQAESMAGRPSAKERRDELKRELSAEKKVTRQSSESPISKRLGISLETMLYLNRKQKLEAELRAERAKHPPLNYWEWVEEQAQKGDARAVVQLRGWRYQENRLVKAMERATEGDRTEAGAGTIATTDSSPRVPYAADLANARLRELAGQEQYAALLKGIRWEANLKTGAVSYKKGDQFLMLDRGRSITVAGDNAAATRLALEMAIHKYGIHLDVQGTEEWKKLLLPAAVKQERNLVFTDADLQRRYEALKLKTQEQAKIRIPNRGMAIEG